MRLPLKDRLKILDQIDDLLRLDAAGADVSAELIRCGIELGADDTEPKKEEPFTEEEYKTYLQLAKQKDVPVRVYKDRIRRGKDPKTAAETPYYKKSEVPEKEFLLIAEANGISRNTYYWRRRRGWSELDAATEPLIKPSGQRKRKVPKE